MYKNQPIYNNYFDQIMEGYGTPNKIYPGMAAENPTISAATGDEVKQMANKDLANTAGKAGLMAAGTALGGPVGLIGAAAVGGIGDYLVSQAKAEREKKIQEQKQAIELQKLQQQQQEQARLKGLETQGEAMYRGGMASQNALAQLMGNYGKAFL